MSAISGFINTIRNAVYGEQVRTAIVSALEACYSDVNTPSLQTEAFETALNEAYAGGILDIQTVTSFSAMTNQKIIYRYNGTTAGKQKGLYYFSALSDSWVLIGSEIQKVSLKSQMTDTNDIYKYTGTESGMVQNSLYCYNGTEWVPIGSAILSASSPSEMTNTDVIYKLTGYSRDGFQKNSLYYFDGTAWKAIESANSAQTIDDKFSYVTGLREIILLPGIFGAATGETRINITSRTQSTTGYKSAKVPCGPGDVFSVSGNSQGTTIYAWAITTNDGTIIQASELGDAVYENEIITIPNNNTAKYLIVNQQLAGKTYDANSLRFFMNNIKGFADGSIYYFNEVYQGSYYSAGGFSGASNRIRSNIIPVAAGAKIKFFGGSNAYEFTYGLSTNGNYYQDHPWVSGTAEITIPSTVTLGNVILVFRRSNDADITPQDFDAVVLINTSNAAKEVPPTKYPETVGIKTAKQYVNLKWTPKEPVPKQGGATYWPANELRYGMLYSDTYMIGKVVGLDVSLRTFMTALNDPYSLIYTENINGFHSESDYGITYNGDSLAGAYYGMACNDFMCSVLGCLIPYHTKDLNGWANETGIFETVYDQSANGVELLDVMVTNGHVQVVTNIWKDDGVTTVIQLSESVAVGVTSKNWSASEFNNLFENSGYRLLRYKYLYQNINYKPQTDFVAVGDEVLTPYVYNDDICTFAGDYAAFAEGDLLYIDYTKGSYSSMEIYKNDTLLETITLNSDSAIHQINLTEKNYTFGKYKARLTDGTNNSDFCYWEILNGTLSVSGNTLTATSANATPVFWGWANATNGTAQKYLFNGEVTADISGAHRTGFENIIVAFQGDYGRIRKVITP